MFADKIVLDAGEDLHALEVQLQSLRQQEVELAEKIKFIKDAEREKIISGVKDVIRKYDIKVDEVFPRGKDDRAAAKLGAVEKNKKEKIVMYRNAAGETWSGSSRGRKPKWVNDALAKNEDIEQYRVA